VAIIGTDNRLGWYWDIVRGEQYLD